MSFDTVVTTYFLAPFSLLMIGYAIFLKSKMGRNWQIKQMVKYSPYKINPKNSRDFVNRQSILLLISGCLILFASFSLNF